MAYVDPRTQQQPGTKRNGATTATDPRVTSQPGYKPPAATPAAPAPTVPSAPAAPTTPAVPTVGPTLPPQTWPVFDSGVQPISLGSGQYYNPTTAPYGFDMTAPGTREQFWNNNQGLWMQSPQLDWVDSQLGQFKD